MFKETKRKGFNFFRSYFDVYNELDRDAKVDFMDALLERQFLGVKPKGLKGMASFAYISQTNSIDSQVKGYEDKTGTKLLSTPTVGGTQGGKDTPTEQVQEEVQEEVQGEVEVKEQVEDRETEFKNSLQPFLEEFGSDTLNNFYLYWTEKKPKGRKMLFEMQKTFDIKRRLDRWNKNNFGNKEKSSAKKEKIDAALILHKRHGLS